jgi:uncharacterized RDD family membrane protein YckC
MSDGIADNRFAPPRAQVEDQHDHEATLVAATRLSRFLAILVDSVVPMVIGGIILAAIAIPAYERYKQQHVPGIAPPPLGTAHHLTLAWAWLGGAALLGYLVYSLVLVYRYGQTFGKRMMGIRVVRMDGSRVAFARFIFLRWLPLALLGLVPYVKYVIGLLDSLLIFRASSRCLHDDIADTQVVTAESSADATLAGDPKFAGQALRTITF